MSLLATLLVVALMLFFFEIFMPGGVLAVIGGILLLIAAGLAWNDYGPMWAMLIFFGGTLAGLILFFIEIKLLASSRIGRQIRLESAITGTALPPPPVDLVGQEGVTLTTCAPAGKVAVHGQTYEASSVDGLLPAGTQVRILRADPFKLVISKK
jgi:membrane-bound serine protease (ClpP class)